jgi:hypothetical protein
MSVAFVQGKANQVGATTLALAFTSNNVAGNFIIAQACIALTAGHLIAPTDANATVTDSRGNTYTPVDAWQLDTGDDNFTRLYYAMNVAAGANTVTLTNNDPNKNAFSALVIAEFSGVATTSALTAHHGTSSPTGGASTATGASFTPASGNLALGALMTNASGGAQTFTPGTGWFDGATTPTHVLSTGTGADINAAMEWQLGAGTSTAATWTVGTPGNDTSRSLAYAEFAAAGGGPTSWSTTAGATVTPTLTASRLGTWTRLAALLANVGSTGQFLGSGFLPGPVAGLLSTTAQRLVASARASSATIIPALTGLRGGLFQRTQALALTTIPTGVRGLVLGRVATPAAVFTPAAGHALGFVRAVGTTILPTTTATRLRAALRTAAVSLVPATTAQRLLTALRSGTVTVTTLPGALRSAVLGRTAALTVNATTGAARLQGALRNAGNTIIVSIADSNVLQHAGAFVRSAGISLFVVTAAPRSLVMTRAQAVTSTLSPAVGRSLGFARAVAITLTTASVALRSAVLRRATALSLSTTTGVTRATSALRAAGATLSATIADSNVLQTAGAWVRSAGVSLVLATTAPRSLVMRRSQALTLTLAPVGGRLQAALRATAAVLTPTTQDTRLYGALRSTGTTLTSVVTQQVAHGIVRATALVLSPAVGAARALAMSRFTGRIITVVTSAAGSGSFSPPLVQIANWAFSRTRKGIRELVLAYQSIQSHLGHTSDTSANFDAGFATFSGQDDSPLPHFPDPQPPAPAPSTDGLETWVQSHLHSGNYELVMAFAASQEAINNYAASSASYDAAYALFIDAQENVPWPH